MTDDVEDTEYYRRRAEASRRMADRARDTGIAAIHREMAALYDGLVAQAAASRPRLTIVPRR